MLAQIACQNKMRICSKEHNVLNNNNLIFIYCLFLKMKFFLPQLVSTLLGIRDELMCHNQDGSATYRVQSADDPALRQRQRLQAGS